MTLAQKILQIYPELQSMRNVFTDLIILQDDSNGQGPYIKVWNYSEPEPTKSQLDAIS